MPIMMDSVVVHAARGGWDVGAFIKRVQTDTTFYKAFKSLHLISYTATNDISMFSKKGTLKASLLSHTLQQRKGACRAMTIVNQKTTGDFFTRSGDYRYYTAELYASLFLQKGPVCNENDVVGSGIKTGGSTDGLQHRKDQLKQLMFNPGKRISGIPFIGDKAGIFDEDIAPMYSFQLRSENYQGEDCYFFSATPKPKFKSEVVYNELSTWFRKSDYAIVARNYALSYHTLVYDFEVTMKVRMMELDHRLIPAHIEYTGDWRVITKGRETGKFVLDISSVSGAKK